MRLGFLCFCVSPARFHNTAQIPLAVRMAAMRNKLAGEMAQPVAAREAAVADTPFVGAGPTPTTTGGDTVGNTVEDDSGDSSDSDSSGVGTDDEGTGNQRSDAAPGVAAEAGGGAASSSSSSSSSSSPTQDGVGEGLDISAGGHPVRAPRGQTWRGKSPLFSKSIKDAPKPVLDAELDFLESMSVNLGFAGTKNSSPERKFPTEVGGVMLSPSPSLCLPHRCTHIHMQQRCTHPHALSAAPSTHRAPPDTRVLKLCIVCVQTVQFRSSISRPFIGPLLPCMSW